MGIIRLHRLRRAITIVRTKWRVSHMKLKLPAPGYAWGRFSFAGNGFRFASLSGYLLRVNTTTPEQIFEYEIGN